MEIRLAEEAELPQINGIINEAAVAYRDVIPADRWHEPYMPMEEMQRELGDGVVFWVAEEDGVVLGVMGMQDRGEVELIRHAYVSSRAQRGGIGTALLRHIVQRTSKPILIGTWAAAHWAIAFYQRNGFRLVDDAEKNRLLTTYWTIPERQIETSVVLAQHSAGALTRQVV